MKRRNLILTMALLFVTVFAFGQNKDDKRVMMDAEKSTKLLKSSDEGIEKFMDNAAGYVVFPNVGEGALIVGAASGNGVVYSDGMPIGMASLKKLDIGLQAGGEAYTEIIFFETEDALNEFKEGNFELSAEAKVIMVDKGASKNANYSDGVIVFVRPKAGAMADISVGGQKFSYSEF
ncbi:lipid-binding SYLF domain-containing protein [Winogradskyella schleiferi]|uniref:lipid-binding SYLF domain-containing protein n=1 Tax=Winogradskyella schleiferi TaxID=2686078 RepID=UPI0015C1673A|nr:lipid-binding SYLF domain-containing protein [Winogradskyella schleiferi]